MPICWFCHEAVLNCEMPVKISPFMIVPGVIESYYRKKTVGGCIYCSLALLQIVWIIRLQVILFSYEIPFFEALLSQLMRLWYFSSSVNSFFKRACTAIQCPGLDVWFLVGPFVHFHTSCVWTAKALSRLRECAGSPEPSLVAYVISTIISWAGSYVVCVAAFLCAFEQALSHIWHCLDLARSLMLTFPCSAASVKYHAPDTWQ